jgi:hypothetical protein
MAKTYGMKEHAELIKATFANRGFVATITNNGNVRISLENRAVYTNEVSWVIDREELPISSNQLRPTNAPRKNSVGTTRATIIRL